MTATLLPTATTSGSSVAARRSQRGPLRRSIHAELIKLTRRNVVVTTALAVAAVGAGGTAIGILTAQSTDQASGDGPALLSIEALADAGGGTAVFSQTASFMSAFLLAVLIGAVAAEFTRGTFRTMLLQQPGRVRVLGGKLVAIVGFAAAATVVAAAVSWCTARLLAPGQGIDTTQWFGVDALAAAGEDLGRALLYLVGTAVLATMVGVLARSVPVGVGVGLVWAGPIENIIGDSWAPAQRWFPGLLLRAVINPGSTSVSTSTALFTLAGYAVAAIGVITVALRRRDVTS